MFGLLGQAVGLWRGKRLLLALVAIVLAALFLANIGYVATGRTTLVTMIVIFAAFSWWYFPGKNLLTAALVAVVIGCLVWFSSDYLRERVMHVGHEVEAYQSSGEIT